MKKDYKSSFISALIGLMIANAIYDLLPIPTETLIVFGILVGLELGCLFPDHDNKKANIKRSQINNLASFSTLNSFLSSPSG